MKRLAFAALLSLPLLLVPARGEAKQASATIDRKCHAKPAKIVVPRGKQAVSFRLKRLQNGRKCVVGGTPDHKGFSIKKRYRVVYRYSQWKRKKPSESPVPLSKLSLGPGTYWLYVGGGNGARATLTYKLR